LGACLSLFLPRCAPLGVRNPSLFPLCTPGASSLNLAKRELPGGSAYHRRQIQIAKDLLFSQIKKLNPYIRDRGLVRLRGL
jgi:hypothetical protein